MIRYDFDSVAHLDQQSRIRLVDLARKWHRPIFSCSAGYALSSNARFTLSNTC